jgi:tetratricopeptide (TPR) repeat protein
MVEERPQVVMSLSLPEQLQPDPGPRLAYNHFSIPVRDAPRLPSAAFSRIILALAALVVALPVLAAPPPAHPVADINAHDYLHSGPGLTGIGVEHVRWGPAQLDAAVKANPLSPTAYIERGNMYLFDSELEKAKADFNKALFLDPKCGKAHIGLSRIFECLRDWPNALAELDKAAAVSTPMYAADAQFEAAFLHRELGQFPEALAGYEKLIKSGVLSPSREALAIFQRGETFLRMGKTERGLADLNLSLSKDPNRQQCHLVRAQVFMQMNKPKLALADLTWIIDTDPTTVSDVQQGKRRLLESNVLRKRAAVYKQLNRPDLAAQDEKRAIALDREMIDDIPFMSR